MSDFTEQIRTQIADEDIESAMGSLISSLKSGDKQIYDRAIALSRKLKRPPSARTTHHTSPPKKQIQTFLRQLEQKHKPMLSFIESVKLGDQYFEQGSWVKSLQHYKDAFELHQSKFQLNRESLTHKIELCQKALGYNYQLDMGEECLNRGIWNKAISHLNQARTFFHDELPYNIKELESRLLLAKNGLKYERHVDMGRGLKSQFKYKEAREAFEHALTSFHEEFVPEKSWLENAIEECGLLEKEAADKSFFSVKRIWANNRVLIIWGGVVSLILLLFFLVATNSFDSDISSIIDTNQQTASVPIQNKSLHQKDTVQTTREDVHATEDLPEENLAASPLSTATEPDFLAQEKRDSLLKVEKAIAEIVDEVLKSDEALTSELDSLIVSEVVNDSLKIEAAAEKTPARTVADVKGVPVSSDARKIAVVPFCDGINDPALLRRFYLDATFALSNSKLPAISKNVVNGKIKELNILQNQSCSKLHNSRLGRALQADFLLMGSVEKLANDQVEINCKVLELSTGSFSKEIIVTDKNIAALREKLKNEIPKLFSKGL